MTRIVDSRSVLAVRDLERSTRFHVDVLGFDSVRRDTLGADYGAVGAARVQHPHARRASHPVRGAGARRGLTREGTMLITAARLFGTFVLCRSAALIVAVALVAGPAMLPAQAHGHHTGHSTARPDATVSAALAAQLEAVRAATARYADPANAKRDGYVKFGRHERALMGEHWYRKDLVDQPLDLAMPSTLQYATIEGRLTLIGVAFTVYQHPGEDVPEGFAGSSDYWHTHDVVKLAGMLTGNRPLLRWVIDRRIARGKVGGGNGRTQLAMVHAWVWLENPAGVFAERHLALPFLQSGLPVSWADGASENAAWGIATLQPGMCKVELDIIREIAGADREQRKELAAACEGVRLKVRQAIDHGSSAAALQQVADSAWSGFLAQRDRVLTPQQLERLAAMVEHPT